MPNDVNANLALSTHEYKQWFTGPILTPTPITMPVGHPGLEVAFLVGENYGRYNSHWKVKRTPSIWSIGPYVIFKLALINFLELNT